LVAGSDRFELWRKRRRLESLRRRWKQRLGGKCMRCLILWSLMSLQICGKIDFKIQPQLKSKKKKSYFTLYPFIMRWNIWLAATAFDVKFFIWSVGDIGCTFHSSMLFSVILAGAEKVPVLSLRLGLNDMFIVKFILECSWHKNSFLLVLC